MKCFTGSPKRCSSLLLVCRELLLTPASSTLESSDAPCGGSNFSSFSPTDWFFPQSSSATFCNPSWVLDLPDSPTPPVPGFYFGMCPVYPRVNLFSCVELDCVLLSVASTVAVCLVVGSGSSLSFCFWSLIFSSFSLMRPLLVFLVLLTNSVPLCLVCLFWWRGLNLPLIRCL